MNLQNILSDPKIIVSLVAAAASIFGSILTFIFTTRSAKQKAESERYIADKKSQIELSIARINSSNENKKLIFHKAYDESKPILLTLDNIWTLLQRAKTILQSMVTDDYVNMEKAIRDLETLESEMQDGYNKHGAIIKSATYASSSVWHSTKGEIGTIIQLIKKEISERKIQSAKESLYAASIIDIRKSISDRQNILIFERSKIIETRYSYFMKFLEG